MLSKKGRESAERHQKRIAEQNKKRLAEHQKSRGITPKSPRSTSSNITTVQNQNVRPPQTIPNTFTPINNIQKSDVLPEFRGEFGFEQTPGGRIGPASPEESAAMQKAIRKNSPAFVPSMVRGLFDPFNAGLNSPRSLQEQAGESIGAFLGVLPFVKPLKGVNSAVKGAKAFTAVDKLSTIGTKGLSNLERLASGSAAAGIATNTATTKSTASWIMKLGRSLRSPQLVAGGLIAAVGSYPFAGFIKEEALQTLGFGVKSAIDNGNLDAAEQALDLQDEILNPDLWTNIKAGIPFLNVVDNLNDFFEAARIKTSIDRRIVNDLRIQEANGESNEDMFKRVSEERANNQEVQRASDEAYYAQIASLKREAEIAARNEDAAFWDEVLSRRREQELEQRRADEAYWTAYWKEMNKLREDSRPSKLNFGLL